MVALQVAGLVALGLMCSLRALPIDSICVLWMSAYSAYGVLCSRRGLSYGSPCDPMIQVQFGIVAVQCSTITVLYGWEAPLASTSPTTSDTVPDPVGTHNGNRSGMCRPIWIIPKLFQPRRECPRVRIFRYLFLFCRDLVVLS